MRMKLVKVAAVVLVTVLLFSVPGVVGCGDDGGDGGKPEVIIGFLGDLTGPGAFAVKPTFVGMRDYFKMVGETGAMPEAKVKFITYDSKGDRGRVQPGYKWLKGQGCMMISSISGDEAAILLDSLKADKIPDFCSGTSLDIFGTDWAYGSLPPPLATGQAIGHWIEENWDGTGVAKVGLVGLGPLRISREVRDAIEEWCSKAANMEFVTSQMVPYGTTAWAAEIEHLKGCDYIVDSTIGSSMATFEMAIHASGYQGQMIGFMESCMAFWDLARDIVPPDQLDGTLAMDMYVDWHDDIPFAEELIEYTDKYLSPEEAAEARRGVARIGGWANGMIVTEGIRNAIADVGAENLSGQAIRDGLLAVDLDVEGWGNVWKVFGNVNSFMQTLRMMEWNASGERWIAVSDWYTPPLCQG